MSVPPAMAAIEAVVPADVVAVEGVVREALSEQGFGVLTEIDVASTLRERIGVERPPLKILGACNPAFANTALEIDPSVALVLPCNVVIEWTDAGTKVSAVDPMELMADPRFADLAAEVHRRLSDAIETVKASVPAQEA